MKISILQWNVWYQEDIKNIVEFLKENIADIICLQELTINFDKQNFIHTPEYLAKELGYNLYYQDITFADKDFKLANAIFSKYPIADAKTVWINQEQGSGNYDDENRAYVESKIQIENRQLTVGTVHMSYTHRFEPSERKLAETTNLVEAISANSENFILTGDFNAAPNSTVIQALEKNLKNCGPDYRINTWTTKPFNYNGFEVTNLEWRLDYIFSSGDIKTVSSKVLNTKFSDHLPVLAEIELK